MSLTTFLHGAPQIPTKSNNLNIISPLQLGATTVHFLQESKPLWFLKCCVFQPQQSVVAFRHKLPLCHFSNVVTFSQNKLWQPLVTNNLSVTFQMLCPSATTVPSSDHKSKFVKINIFSYNNSGLARSQERPKKKKKN